MPFQLHVALLIATVGGAQPLPPAGDGDIRTVYYELQNVSDIWLTLEPRNLKGERAPLVFWAPRAELWFELDGGERIDLSMPSAALLTGAASDYWSGRRQSTRRSGWLERIGPRS